MFETEEEREEYIREAEERLNSMLLEFEKELRELEHVCMSEWDEDEIFVGENC